MCLAHNSNYSMYHVVQVYEYVLDDGKVVRGEGIEKLDEFVRDSQEYAMIEHHVSK